MKKANAVIANARIRDVRLIKLETFTRVPGPEVIEAPEASLDTSARIVEGPHEDGSFLVNSDMKCRITSKNDNDPYFSLVATFEIFYRVPTDVQYTDEEMQFFVESNAVFNTWPYYRELVQSILSRMKLPHVVLPLFIYGNVPTKATTTESPT